MNIKIKIKRFRKNYKIAQNIYNTHVVLDYFCSSLKHIEEIANIYPVVEHLKDESDQLYYDLSNILHGLDENGETKV